MSTTVSKILTYISFSRIYSKDQSISPPSLAFSCENYNFSEAVTGDAL